MRDRGRRLNYSDRELEFVEGSRQPEHRRGFNTKLVVAAADVLDEGVPSEHDAGSSVGFESAHRSQPGLQSAVVCLAPVVLVLTGVVERRRDQVRGHVR